MAWTNPLAGRVTSGFGNRWGAFHTGTDISPTAGYVMIGAATAGTVVAVRRGSRRGDTRSGVLPGRTGNGVLLDHGGGIRTYYGHMATVVVNPGQLVSTGQTLGRVGNTGNTKGATGIHLHFEVLVNGRAVNPVPFMSARGVSLGYGRTSYSTGPVVPITAYPSVQMRATPLVFTINIGIPKF